MEVLILLKVVKRFPNHPLYLYFYYGSYRILTCRMTSPASDDHGVGREYQVPSWLDPIYTQAQRTIMGRVRPRRGHPFLKFHPQTKEFEWLGDQPRKIFLCRAVSTKYEPEVTSVKRRRGRPRKEAPAPSTEGTPVSPVEEPPRKKRGRLQKSSTPKESTA